MMALIVPHRPDSFNTEHVKRAKSVEKGTGTICPYRTDSSPVALPLSPKFDSHAYCWFIRQVYVWDMCSG